AQPYGAALRWPQSEAGRRPGRSGGAHVVLGGAEPVVFIERGGKGLLTLVDHDDPRLRPALEALARFVTAGGPGRSRRLALERIDGEAVLGSPVEPLLVELGFRAGPRKLTLST
nr:hypothetical protein [Solirubrobacterales bacterium]